MPPRTQSQMPSSRHYRRGRCITGRGSAALRGAKLYNSCCSCAASSPQQLAKFCDPAHKAPSLLLDDHLMCIYDLVDTRACHCNFCGVAFWSFTKMERGTVLASQHGWNTQKGFPYHDYTMYHNIIATDFGLCAHECHSIATAQTQIEPQSCPHKSVQTILQFDGSTVMTSTNSMFASSTHFARNAEVKLSTNLAGMRR